MGLGQRQQRYFNPRPPWGGRRRNEVFGNNRRVISIHALRGEGDRHLTSRRYLTSYFNPRPPWGGRPSSVARIACANVFQSTPSVGRATVPYASVYGDIVISIHALRGEGDQSASNCWSTRETFQSTPSVGRATVIFKGGKQKMSISIHALRGEGDIYMCLAYCAHKIFQSTPSVGRATCKRRQAESGAVISIHALRGEGDKKMTCEDCIHNISIPALRGEGDSNKAVYNITAKQNFNPRPPWGGRLLLPLVGLLRRRLFQSTPSVGRATACPDFRGGSGSYFNPRPPWGGRQFTQISKSGCLNFNPRPPWGGRLPRPCRREAGDRNFNPRPPWGGRPHKTEHGETDVPISIHALRGEGDTSVECPGCRIRIFQSTPSVGRAT